MLYTSFEREGALAEISFHWALFVPRPTKAAHIHRLGVRSDRALRLVWSSLDDLGVDAARYADPNYRRTQEIGAAVAFIGCDGLIAPSARWKCENLILITDNLSMDVDIKIKETEEVDWQAWARSVGMI